MSGKQIAYIAVISLVVVLAYERYGAGAARVTHLRSAA